MTEGKWHKKIRRELIEKYKKEGYQVKVGITLVIGLLNLV